jgi:hypothetical protein
MLFTRKSINNTTKPIETRPQYNMRFFRSKTTSTSTVSNQSRMTTLTQPKPSDRERMTWGAPTWTLLHIIPEKLTNDTFVKHKDDIIRLIVTICSNLPCPSCSQHASDYMKRVNFIAIKTTDDLKKMLFVFHNSVNERKGYIQYSYDNLDNRYINLNMVDVINEFMSHFQKKTYALNLIAQQIYRQKQVEIVKKWFRDHLDYFQ